jgi:predicted metal-dependent phosphoesterase TrpH
VTQYFVDLHIHTTASDGTFTPVQIVHMAMEKGLSAIAITDHDSVDGIAPALEAGRRYGFEVVPGIEIGVLDEPERDLIDVDILGYFIDHSNTLLRTTLKKIKGSRWNWLIRQILALEMELKIRIPLEEVLVAVGASPTVRRPHIYRTIEKLYPGRIQRAEFYSLTDHGGRLYVEKEYEIGLEECIRLIRQARGKAALAHPEDYPKVVDKERLLRTCVDAGISAVEVYYPYCYNRLKCSVGEQDRIFRKYKGLARQYGLAEVGGSDFHGAAKPEVELGTPGVPYSCLEQLKTHLDIRTGPLL